jgi:phosphate transport system protein
MAARAENPGVEPEAEHRYLVDLTLQACEVARTAVAHAADGIASNGPSLFLAVDECEKELDALDRELDERLTHALGLGPDTERRELLCCMKFMTDLERIGDLVSTFAIGARSLGPRLEPQDVKDLIRIASILERMLADVRQAFSARDLDRAISVLRADSEIDRLRNLMFVRHVENPEGQPTRESIQVLFMAQSLERAGDHAKNCAEEVCHFVSGHTLRHVLRANGKSNEQMFLDWLKLNRVKAR